MTRPFARVTLASLPAVIGCDEVGRGALSGPVVTAAVWFHCPDLPRGLIRRLDDSKKLTREEREELYPLLRRCAAVAFAARSARVIDRVNIRQATLAAMRQAVLRLGVDAPVRIDGIDVPPGLPHEAQAVVRGDGKVPQIAAASILAKVMRDRLMARLGARHTGYDWHANAGYGTAAHRRAIRALGPTSHHRLSFGEIFSDRAERLVAQPAPDMERLHGLGHVVHAEQLHTLSGAE